MTNGKFDFLGNICGLLAGLISLFLVLVERNMPDWLRYLLIFIIVFLAIYIAVTILRNIIKPIINKIKSLVTNNQKREKQLNFRKLKLLVNSILIGLALLSLAILVYLLVHRESFLPQNMVLIKLNAESYPNKYFSIKDFYISKAEITTKEYLQFLNETGDNAKHQPQWKNPQLNTNSHISTYYSGFTYDEQPIVGINWDQANAYCEWLSQKTGMKYRLPTALEWEIAARAGGSGKFGLNENKNEISEQTLDRYAWFFGNQNQGQFKSKTRPVMQKAPNYFGLYDIWGNAAEWTSDEADNGGKICKGGSWEDPPKYCETEFKDALKPDEARRTISFRIVLEK